MLALFALISPSFASPIAAPGTIGAPDSGPATPDPAAVHYNPAAMGGSKGVDGMFDLQLSQIEVTHTSTRHDGIDPNTGEKYEPSQAKVLVPVGLVGVTWKPFKWGAIGFAATDSFVGGGDYSGQEAAWQKEHDDGDEPKYRASTRYAGIKTQIITVALMPAIAITPIEGFHAGGGFSYVLDKVSLTKASDPLGSEGKGFGDGEENAYVNDVILSAEGSGAHTAWNAGIFVDRWKLFQVGASYSSAGVIDVAGDANVHAPDFIAEGSGPVDIKGKFAFSMPLAPVIRVGAASQINDKLKVGATVEYYMWKDCCGGSDGDAKIGLTSKDGDPIGAEDGLALEVDDTIYAPRRLWNSLVIGANGGYWVTEGLWVGGRLGYKQYAVPDYAVSATNIDFDAYGVCVSARYRFAKKYTVGLAYTKNFLTTRTIKHSGWDVRDPEDSDYVDERFTTVAPYTASGNGTYAANNNVFGLRLGVDL